MIRIENLVHKYDFWESNDKKIKKTVLDGISFDIPSGQFLAILGPNGCGKSTLAKHLNVLLLPDEGTVWIDGKNTSFLDQHRAHACGNGQKHRCHSAAMGSRKKKGRKENHRHDSGNCIEFYFLLHYNLNVIFLRIFSLF